MIVEVSLLTVQPMVMVQFWTSDGAFQAILGYTVRSMKATLEDLAADPQPIPALLAPLPVDLLQLRQSLQAQGEMLWKQIMIEYSSRSEEERVGLYEHVRRLMPEVTTVYDRIQHYNRWVATYNNAVQGICTARVLGMPEEAASIAANFELLPEEGGA